ncbi:hypothetical protein DNH61_05025 [Paenibacillus sambharensis]|uniref:DUF1861 domain-containing protein n=1 Tax=Paenibacillus sambharensis TaxID=1803190 RepID=A0A2W1LG23_9BACL|nr:DUF1861 family protein [Paenibacillus sambharensis]PZD97010.1 hypothetical protein DNH61_05025 [Paenibacillus sambharensis]
MQNKRATLDCDLLLKEFHVREVPVLQTEKLAFTGVGSRDVYNITAPFTDEGTILLAGRVESRDSESSDVMFFAQQEQVWAPKHELPVFHLQDPFITRVGGELIMGGVQTYPNPEDENRLMWRTVLYRGQRVSELRPFFTGPDGMKDLRLVELEDGGIGVFTRPQGIKGGRGKIGFARTASLEELTMELIAEAPLLEEQFTDAEWGGVNEAQMLSNGLIGVLGHIARFDEGNNRHYYPMIFVLDPDTGWYSDIELIAVRNNFLPGPAKREDLHNVVFSGGLVRNPDGTAVLYAGISDAEAHTMTIPDPFQRFEALTRKNENT